MEEEEETFSENDTLLTQNKSILYSTNEANFYAKMFLVWLVLLTFSSITVYDLSYTADPRIRKESSPSIFIPTQILFTRGEHYEINFTLKENVTDLTFWLDGHLSYPIGLPRGSSLDNYYYSIRLPELEPGREYYWGLDRVTRHRFRTFGPGDKICTVGDTHIPRSLDTFKSMSKSGCGLVIHVGDMSYITNDGTCYPNQYDEECKYSCRGPRCAREGRVTRERLNAWDAFFDQVNFSYTPLVTQMGNHDNDAFWYLKFSPVSSHPFMNQTSFYWSADIVPGLRLISISTEDNNNNPYERWERPREPFDTTRWEMNYGTKSPQYKWFNKQLDTNNTVIVYTHRPPFHTSNHHPDCSIPGNWYRCKYREVWGPLFDHVDYVFSGHSHHWMTTKPSVKLRSQGLLPGGRARFSIVGTGGFELDTKYPLRSHPLIDQLDAKHYGFVLLDYNTNNLTFVRN